MKWRMIWLCLLVAPLPVWAQDVVPPMPAPVLQDPAAVLVTSTPVLTSIFFNDSEREAIAQARQEYQERIQSGGPSEADLLDQLQGIKDAQVQEEALEEKQYEQFYLESLMYHTPNDWTLWIRNIHGSDKYAPDTVQDPKSTFRLLSINKESATFEWKPRNWSYVSKKFANNTPGISLDPTKKTVVFTLWVNQTLQSHNMSIVEGFAPVVLIPDAGAITTPIPETKPLQEPTGGNKP